MRVVLADLRAGTRPACELMIVTGRGKHSIGSAVLQREVRRFLEAGPVDAPRIAPLKDADAAAAGFFVLEAGAILDWLGARGGGAN